MRITLLTIGTRGDVWPLAALAAHLTDLGHDTTVATHERFATLVAATGSRFMPMPTDFTDYATTPGGQAMLRAGGMKLVAATGKYFGTMRRELDDAALAACEGAEALVAMHMTYDRAVVIADHLRIPVAMTFPNPVGLTRAYSSPMIGVSLPPGRLSELSHQLVLALYERGNKTAISALRSRLGLPEPERPAMRRMAAAQALQLHPFSPAVLGDPDDWGPDQLMTGFWRLPERVRLGAGETVPADVRAFVDAGPAPLYLGLGSMPAEDPAGLMRDVIAVTDRLGVRALVDEQWCAHAGDLPAHLHPVGAADHDALLPLCAGAVHHGGAGTTAASLRAGIPTLICSVFSDQPFWGRTVARHGVGAHIAYRKLDRARLQAGMARLREPAVIARAAALGRTIRAEGDGTVVAARALDDWLVSAEPLPLPQGEVRVDARAARAGYGTPGSR